MLSWDVQERRIRGQSEPARRRRQIGRDGGLIRLDGFAAAELRFDVTGLVAIGDENGGLLEFPEDEHGDTALEWGLDGGELVEIDEVSPDAVDGWYGDEDEDDDVEYDYEYDGVVSSEANDRYARMAREAEAERERLVPPLEYSDAFWHCQDAEYYDSDYDADFDDEDDYSDQDYFDSWKDGSIEERLADDADFDDWNDWDADFDDEDGDEDGDEDDRDYVVLDELEAEYEALEAEFDASLDAERAKRWDARERSDGGPRSRVRMKHGIGRPAASKMRVREEVGEWRAGRRVIARGRKKFWGEPIYSQDFRVGFTRSFRQGAEFSKEDYAFWVGMSRTERHESLGLLNGYHFDFSFEGPRRHIQHQQSWKNRRSARAQWRGTGNLSFRLVARRQAAAQKYDRACGLET